jgi:hypothetical protein
MTTKEHLALHDRQIKAIRELIQEGMRLVVQTRKDMRTIVAMQKQTSEDLRTLVNTLKRGVNGHSKKKIDLRWLSPRRDLRTECLAD